MASQDNFHPKYINHYLYIVDTSQETVYQIKIKRKTWQKLLLFMGVANMTVRQNSFYVYLYPIGNSN